MNFPTQGSKVYYRNRTVGNIYKKYGEHFLFLLHKFNSGDYGLSLAAIGRKYGISREYVRQIFNLLYDKGARSVLRNNPENDLTCSNDPRHKIAEHSKTSYTYIGALKEKEFYDECLRRGYDCRPECAACIDFNVNGFLVEVKSRTATYFGEKNKTPIAMYNVRSIQYEAANFFACWHPALKCWFIIPKESVRTKSHQICISCGSSYKTAKNKYHEFKDAWHLLQPQIRKTIDAIGG